MRGCAEPRYLSSLISLTISNHSKFLLPQLSLCKEVTVSNLPLVYDLRWNFIAPIFVKNRSNSQRTHTLLRISWVIHKFFWYWYSLYHTKSSVTLWSNQDNFHGAGRKCVGFRITDALYIYTQYSRELFISPGIKLWLTVAFCSFCQGEDQWAIFYSPCSVASLCFTA